MDGGGRDCGAGVWKRPPVRRSCPYCYADVTGPGLVASAADEVSTDVPSVMFESGEVHSGRYCPACARPLPTGWEDVTTTCLTVVAYRAGGSQAYLGVMGNLLSRWGQANGLTVTHYDRTFTDRLAEFGDTTDQELTPLCGRPIGMPDWVLRIHRPGRDHDHVLVVGCVMAEDLPRGMSSGRQTRISDADGLILLVDAAECPVVRSALGIGADMRPERDPASVWFAVDAQLQQDLQRPAAHPPRAVTIAKFDLIRAAGTAPDSTLGSALAGAGLRIHHDPSLLDPRWSSHDADLLDGELRTLCSHYLGLPQLVSAAHEAERDGDLVQFFAVSPLGRTPSARKMAPSGVPSYRCLDPIKWFLMQSDLIEAG